MTGNGSSPAALRPKAHGIVVLAPLAVTRTIPHQMGRIAVVVAKNLTPGVAPCCCGEERRMSIPEARAEMPEDEIYKPKDMHGRYTSNTTIGRVYGQARRGVTFPCRSKIIVEANG